jgi:hypothetical protein
MNRRDFLTAGSAATALAAVSPWQSLGQATAPILPASGADGWVSLLNGRDLSGWYTMLQKAGKGVAEKRGMVVMEEGMLHIMGNLEDGDPAEPGYLATNQEFENAHIRVEYKWGMKRFAPRTYTKRDNGILYGLVGADKVWPTCVECQIEEGDVGDYFFVGTRGIQDNHANGFFGETLGPNGWPGPPKAPAAGQTDLYSFRKIKDGNFEILDGWNTVEVIWQGDRSAHIVNGRAVNAASKIEQPDPANAGQFIPLRRGKIAIELEFAEIWFRRIEVKSLV